MKRVMDFTEWLQPFERGWNILEQIVFLHSGKSGFVRFDSLIFPSKPQGGEN